MNSQSDGAGVGVWYSPGGFWVPFSVECGEKFTRLKKSGRGFLTCRDCQGEQNRIIDTDMRGWRFRGGAEERQ